MDNRPHYLYVDIPLFSAIYFSWTTGSIADSTVLVSTVLHCMLPTRRIGSSTLSTTLVRLLPVSGRYQFRR
jgi:hypothetical protein